MFLIFASSGQIKTLVAMATYIFHRLKMGKWKIDIFHSLWGYLNIFTEMFIEQSSVFHMKFVQIAKFDWLPG